MSVPYNFDRLSPEDKIKTLLKALENAERPITLSKRIAIVSLGAIGVLVLLSLCIGASWRSYERYQTLADERNQTIVNEIRISQQQQLVQVEAKKAEIRIVEAKGIAESQRIINASLTDKYLQHEAIGAQKAMVNSPNHTTVYIPSGQNGIPLVRTVDGDSK